MSPLGGLVEGDGGLVDVGVGGEDGFDFFEFDAQAAEFDLGVDASEELELEVLGPADEVAAAVDAGVGVEGVFDEAFVGQFGVG